jgi:ketosteroid isomerase-like protein
MSDREQIEDVIATYAHAVDDRDIDRILSCFDPAGRIDFEGGVTSGVGHDGIRTAYEEAFAQPALALPATSTHLMADTLVTIDGDTAHAETQGVAFHASATLGRVMTRGVRYSDDFHRGADGWRITRRVHRSLWQTESPGQVH